MSFLFHNIVFEPLYNALVFLSTVLPGHNIGLAIILLTLIVKFALFPLQHQMFRTQSKLKVLEPRIKEIKEKHAEDKAEQAKRIMEAYKEHGVNPLSGFGLLLIQLPILLGLYYVFRQGFDFHADLIYSFITPPSFVGAHFLGLDLTARSVILSLLTGLTQFIQIKVAMPTPPPNPEGKPSLSNDLARTMSLQMKYVMPVMITAIAYGLPSAISLYWITSNLFALAHQLWVKKEATEPKTLGAN